MAPRAGEEISMHRLRKPKYPSLPFSLVKTTIDKGKSALFPTVP